MSIIEVPSVDSTTLCASAPVREIRTVDQADPRCPDRVRFAVTRHICIENIVHRTLHAVSRPSRRISAHVQIRRTEAVRVKIVHEASPRARHEPGKRCVARRFTLERRHRVANSVEVVENKFDLLDVRNPKIIRNTGGNGVETVRVSWDSGSCPGLTSQPSRCNEHGISSVRGHPTVL